MSIIYSFLQRRKMHENHYALNMVFAAYVLSAFLLALGSDVFYNINPSAAEISKETKEETQKIVKADVKEILWSNDNIRFNNTSLINPYDLPDSMPQDPTVLRTENFIEAAVTNTQMKTADIGKKEIVILENTEENPSTNGDTIWLFGQAMKGEDFDAIMEKVGNQKSKTDNKKASKENNISEEKKAKSDTDKKEKLESLAIQAISGNTTISVSKEEVKMLERIVEAEATGEDMVGKILVVNVILNRIRDEAFPDTVEDVIFQKSHGDYQFSPVSDKRYWSVKVTKGTKEAVSRALQGEDYSEGALYFIARKRSNKGSTKWFDQHLDWLFKHGGHEFYKNK